MNHFYKDNLGNRRKYGIFAPGLDRFVFVDDTDHWMMLETAEILSSKLPTILYLLPTLDFDLNNDNCLNYTVYNKTQERVGHRLTSIARQNPLLLVLNENNKIVFEGMAEDYQSEGKQEILKRLQEYAHFALKQITAINITDAMLNHSSNRTFFEKYAKNTDDIKFKTLADRSTISEGVLKEIRHAIYVSITIDEAREKITQLWLDNYHEQEYLLSGYYRLLNEPIPDVLKDHTVFKTIKLQHFVL